MIYRVVTLRFYIMLKESKFSHIRKHVEQWLCASWVVVCPVAPIFTVPAENASQRPDISTVQ